MRHLRKSVTALAAALFLGVSVASCSGNSIEGTYFGTAGDTVLVLEADGKCGYTDNYDVASYTPDGQVATARQVRVEIDEDCRWSLSGTNLTLIGVSSSGSLTGSVGNDGTLSIPDQKSWSGEIYSKKK